MLDRHPKRLGITYKRNRKPQTGRWGSTHQSLTANTRIETERTQKREESFSYGECTR